LFEVERLKPAYSLLKIPVLFSRHAEPRFVSAKKIEAGGEWFLVLVSDRGSIKLPVLLRHPRRGLGPVGCVEAPPNERQVHQRIRVEDSGDAFPRENE
jgi:hypothetical protein